MRNRTLQATSILPLFDSVFGVALTLLAFSVPDNVIASMDVQRLATSIAIYIFSGISVLVYWFKLRRLISWARVLNPPQLVISCLSLLIVVLLPKLAQLVVLRGNGGGDLLHWTVSQVVNTLFLAVLLTLNLLCLCFKFSLLYWRRLRASVRQELLIALRVQSLCFLGLLVLGALELALVQLNHEFILLVPLLLIIEEIGVTYLYPHT